MDAACPGFQHQGGVAWDSRAYDDQRTVIHSVGMAAEFVRNPELAQHLGFCAQFFGAGLVADEDQRALALKQFRNRNAATGGTNDRDLLAAQLRNVHGTRSLVSPSPCCQRTLKVARLRIMKRIAMI